ncbi:helix-turn-helix domain-containing protein [Pseudonocardia sichuanensis]
MRIRLDLAEDGASITVRADRYSPTMPPARMAAALAAAVESTLYTLRATSPEEVPPTQAPHEPTPVEPALDVPAWTEPAPVEPAPVRPGLVEPARVEPVPAAGAPAAVPAPRAAGLGRDDGEVRARALRLLDDGLTDAQVCAQLGISRGRLLRWDDDLAHDVGLDLLADAGGAR